MRTSNLPRPNACSSLACIADVIQSSVSTGHPANSTNSRSPFTSLAFHVTIEDFTVPRNSKHIFLLREWFDHLSTFSWKESRYFNLGFDCVESWIQSSPPLKRLLSSHFRFKQTDLTWGWVSSATQTSSTPEANYSPLRKIREDWVLKVSLRYLTTVSCNWLTVTLVTVDQFKLHQATQTISEIQARTLNAQSLGSFCSGQ